MQQSWRVVVLVVIALPMGCKSLQEKVGAGTASLGGMFRAAPATKPDEAPKPKAPKPRHDLSDVPEAVRPIVAKAIEWRDDGQLDKAIAELRRGLAAHAKSPDLYHHLARCWYIQSREPGRKPADRQERFQRAVASWEKAMAMDPAFYKAPYSLGVVLYMKAETAAPGERDKLRADARRYWQLAAKAKPEFASSHYNLGRLAHAQEKWAEAKKHYEAALRANPKHLNARSNLAIVEFSLSPDKDEGIKRASEHWRQAIRIDPDHVYSLFNLGRADAEYKRWDAAVDHWTAATRAEPGNEEQRFLQSRAWYCLAVIYEQHRPDLDRCWQAINNAYNMYKDNVEYRHMLRRIDRRRSRESSR